jgi:hypothetical protein
LGTFLFSPAGLIAAAAAIAAGFAYLGVESLEAGAQVDTLATKLRATTTNYTAAAQAATIAGKGVRRCERRIADRCDLGRRHFCCLM